MPDASATESVTVTSLLFQPFAFGGGLVDAVVAGGVASATSTIANTVPPRSVTSGTLLPSSITANRPPETVPSRLSVVSFAGGAPPDPTTGAHAAPVQYWSCSPASAAPTIVFG